MLLSIACDHHVEPWLLLLLVPFPLLLTPCWLYHGFTMCVLWTPSGTSLSMWTLLPHPFEAQSLIQGFADTLQHCIRQQSSVTALYGSFSALKLPYKEVTGFWGVARILKIPVTEFMTEGMGIHDPNTQEVKPTSARFEGLFISESGWGYLR